MQREILEETGLVVKKYNYNGPLTFPNFYGDDKTTFCFVYKITDFEGELIHSAESQLSWIDNDKLQILIFGVGIKYFCPGYWMTKYFQLN